MKFFLIIFFSICSLLVFSQENLVPNSSFEEISGCPATGEDLYLATPWTNPIDSTPFNWWHSALLNGCSSNYGVPYHWGEFVPAHTGIGYAHIYTLNGGDSTWSSEFIQVRLNDSLKKNTSYKISFFVQLAERNAANFATNKLGIYFSNDPINYVKFNYIPQFINTSINLTDKYQWMEIKGSYIANGGERYITIGKFFRESQCDTIYVGSALRSSGRVSGYFIDDVFVGIDSTLSIDKNKKIKQDNEINLYPNPANNYIELNVSSRNDNEFNLYMYNTIGVCVKKIEVSKHSVIDVSQLPGGVYIAVVEDKKGILVGRKKIIKSN